MGEFDRHGSAAKNSKSQQQNYRGLSFSADRPISSQATGQLGEPVLEALPAAGAEQRGAVKRQGLSTLLLRVMVQSNRG